MLRNRTLLCKHSGTVVGLKISTRRSTVIIWRQRQSHQLQTQILRLRDNDLAYVLLHSGQEIKPESTRKAPCGRRRRPVFTCKVLSSFTTTRATRSKYLLPAHTGITLRARVHPVHSTTSSDHRAVRVILRMMQKKSEQFEIQLVKHRIIKYIGWSDATIRSPFCWYNTI